MSLINPNQRVSRGTIYQASSNSNITHNSKKKWSNLLPLFLAVVFISEIAFLGRLEKTDFVNSWAESFYQFTTSPLFSSSNFLETADDDEVPVVGFSDASTDVAGSGRRETCEEWLEKEDHVVYSRNFHTHPVTIAGGDQRSCDVGCKFLPHHKRGEADAAIGFTNTGETSGVLRSMESAKYYPQNDIATARRRGYDVIMTTSLSSDVPVGYFSWAEYDLMGPLEPKTETSMAAAYISNCGALNSRLQVLEKLENLNIKIDSFGACHHTSDEKLNKVEALKHYKFSLAFENSNEEDYVTEKYFQSLVAGSVPVVYGAPNIQDFAPSLHSILQIKDLKDALVDMAAVHSDCRLCILLATKILEKEEKKPEFPKRPCKCNNSGSEFIYHLYVRERGRFNMVSVFLRSGNLTMAAMEDAVLLKFKSLKHETVWRKERQESIRGHEKDLKIYKIYPFGMTQRQALYTFTFNNISFRSHVESNPCGKFEVVNNSWARSLSVASTSFATTRRSEFDSDSNSRDLSGTVGSRSSYLSDLRVFKFVELKSATKGFNRSLVIGEGRFGCVYRGVVKAAAGADAGSDEDRDLDVAIKQLSRNGFQARET
ncbi:hypothetical protein LXL04_017422 [Taraxacum kok-saghyz]